MIDWVLRKQAENRRRKEIGLDPTYVPPMYDQTKAWLTIFELFAALVARRGTHPYHAVIKP